MCIIKTTFENISLLDKKYWQQNLIRLILYFSCKKVKLNEQFRGMNTDTHSPLSLYILVCFVYKFQWYTSQEIFDTAKPRSPKIWTMATRRPPSISSARSKWETIVAMLVLMKMMTLISFEELSRTMCSRCALTNERHGKNCGVS